MHPKVKETFRELTEKFEGCTNYLYLDVVGKVTVGLGCLVDPIALALKLNWRDGATRHQITLDWFRVKNAPPGRPAKYYLDLTTIRLNDIEGLFAKRLNANVDYLRRILPWDDLPADAQLGVLLNAWARGCGYDLPVKNGGQTALLVALEARDFGHCAQLAQIKGNPTGRNEAIRMCFENASDILHFGGRGAELAYPRRVRARAIQRTLRYLDSGDDVRDLRIHLHAPDGTGYDRNTAQVVQALQCAHGLEVDGIVGPKTRRAIGWRAE